MIKEVTHAHLGTIGYHSEHIHQTSFFGGTFFAASYSKTALVFWSLKVKANKLTLLWNRNRIDSPAIVLKKDQLPTHLWWVVVDKSLSLLVTLKWSVEYYRVAFNFFLISGLFNKVRCSGTQGPFACLVMIGEKTWFYSDFDKTRLQSLTFSASKRIVVKYLGWIISNHVQTNHFDFKFLKYILFLSPLPPLQWGRGQK